MINATEPLSQLQQFAAEVKQFTEYRKGDRIPNAPEWWGDSLLSQTVCLCESLGRLSATDRIAEDTSKFLMDWGTSGTVVLSKQKTVSAHLGEIFAHTCSIADGTSHDVTHLYKQGQQWPFRTIAVVTKKLANSFDELNQGFTPARSATFHALLAESLAAADAVRVQYRLSLLGVLQSALDRCNA